MQDEILILSWDMPTINDFDHFNIYSSIDGSAFELLDEPIGVQYFYEEALLPGANYQFYITTVNQTGLESDPSETVELLMVDANGEIIPLATELSSNYPNPFNPATTIDFSLDENEHVELTIYNLKGQRVKQLVNDQYTAGTHSIVWNGKDDNGKHAASGIYFFKMKSGNYSKSKKMLLLK